MSLPVMLWQEVRVNDLWQTATQGRLYSTVVVTKAVGNQSLSTALRKKQIAPYVTFPRKPYGIHAFGPEEVGTWRGWPADAAERVLELAAELYALDPDRLNTQAWIDKEVEKWKTETDTNDTQ